MAKTKDKAFECAENTKDEAVKETVPETKTAEKSEKPAGKKEDKAFDNNKIKIGDFVVYEAAHGNRCVQVLDVSDVDVEVVGDDGSRVHISLNKVKKAN